MPLTARKILKEFGGTVEVVGGHAFDHTNEKGVGILALVVGLGERDGGVGVVGRPTGEDCLPGEVCAGILDGVGEGPLWVDLSPGVEEDGILGPPLFALHSGGTEIFDDVEELVGAEGIDEGEEALDAGHGVAEIGEFENGGLGVALGNDAQAGAGGGGFGSGCGMSRAGGLETAGFAGSGRLTG